MKGNKQDRCDVLYSFISSDKIQPITKKIQVLVIQIKLWQPRQAAYVIEVRLANQGTKS